MTLERRTLVQSRRRLTRAALIAAVFGAIGVLMLVMGQTPIGIVGVAFAVLGLPLIAQQLARPGTLTLDECGFAVTARTKSGTFTRRWLDCGPFSTWGPVTRPVAVRYSTLDKRGGVRRLNRAIAGADEGVVAGYGGHSAQELADIMNAYRNAALVAAGESPTGRA